MGGKVENKDDLWFLCWKIVMCKCVGLPSLIFVSSSSSVGSMSSQPSGGRFRLLFTFGIILLDGDFKDDVIPKCWRNDVMGHFAFAHVPRTPFSF